MSTTIDKATLTFLKDLSKNNSRDWFNDNRGRYEVARDNWKAFALDLVEAMNEVDNITKHKIWRINRDIRFSKDKTPYNTHLSLGLTRKKPELRGGYYLRIMGSGSMVAGGFFGPEKQDLKRIRQEIDRDGDAFRQALADKVLLERFGSLEGDQVKTAPQGYKRDNPNIDLLRYKQFLLTRPIPQKEVLSVSFVSTIVSDYLAMRPFLDLMTDVLTTDENGVPLC
jgi:uncharacterized protein (TIGR02453 family)